MSAASEPARGAVTVQADDGGRDTGHAPAASPRAQAPALLDELSAVRSAVRAQLGELLDAIDSDGGRYADHYAEWMLGRRNGRIGPPAPPKLGPAAELVRELVRDEATAVRMYGVKAAA
jgi:hypothetical protein